MFLEAITSLEVTSSLSQSLTFFKFDNSLHSLPDSLYRSYVVHHSCSYLYISVSCDGTNTIGTNSTDTDTKDVRTGYPWYFRVCKVNIHGKFVSVTVEWSTGRDQGRDLDI